MVEGDEGRLRKRHRNRESQEKILKGPNDVFSHINLKTRMFHLLKNRDTFFCLYGSISKKKVCVKYIENEEFQEEAFVFFISNLYIRWKKKLHCRIKWPHQPSGHYFFFSFGFLLLHVSFLQFWCSLWQWIFSFSFITLPEPTSSFRSNIYLQYIFNRCLWLHYFI